MMEDYYVYSKNLCDLSKMGLFVRMAISRNWIEYAKDR